jgi:hypothetical protein
MSDRDRFWMPLLFLGVPLALAWVYALKQTFRLSQWASRHGESARWLRDVASVLLVLLVVAGFLLAAVVPPWFQTSVPPSVIRRTEIQLLSVAKDVYGAVVLIACNALISLTAVSVGKRLSARARWWTIRYLVLSISILVAAGLAEGVAAACLWARSMPMPWLPTQFEDRSDNKVIDILVIGESSAQGVPYEKWFSVADIVA